MKLPIVALFYLLVYLAAQLCTLTLVHPPDPTSGALLLAITANNMVVFGVGYAAGADEKVLVLEAA
jgi:hypothetical protein